MLLHMLLLPMLLLPMLLLHIWLVHGLCGGGLLRSSCASRRSSRCCHMASAAPVSCIALHGMSVVGMIVHECVFALHECVLALHECSQEARPRSLPAARRATLRTRPAHQCTSHHNR